MRHTGKMLVPYVHSEEILVEDVQSLENSCQSLWEPQTHPLHVKRRNIGLEKVSVSLGINTQASWFSVEFWEKETLAH